MAAAAGPLTYLLLLLSHLPPSSTAQDRRFSESKRCADPECSMLMCRGQAIRDFTGPDCRFLNFKKDELIYVYHKLDGRSSDLWAGSVDSSFGYFPKDLIDVKKNYITAEELVLPTDGTDFVCFDNGQDNFDNYNVDELLNKQKGSTTGDSQPGADPPHSEAAPGESPPPHSEAAPGESPPPHSEAAPGESPPSHPEIAARELDPSQSEAAPGESPPSKSEKAPGESPHTDPETAPEESSPSQSEATPGKSPPTDPETAPEESSPSQSEATPGESPPTDPETAPEESSPSQFEAIPGESPTDPETAPRGSPPSQPDAAPGESPPSKSEKAPGVLPPPEYETSPGEPPSESVTSPEELLASEITLPSPDSEEPPLSESETTPEQSIPESGTPPGEPPVSESGTPPGEPPVSESGTPPGEPPVSESGTPPGEPPVSESGTPPGEPPVSESGTVPREPPVSESGTLPGEPSSSESGTSTGEPPVSESGTLPGEPSSSESGTSTGEPSSSASGTPEDVLSPSESEAPTGVPSASESEAPLAELSPEAQEITEQPLQGRRKEAQNNEKSNENTQSNNLGNRADTDKTGESLHSVNSQSKNSQEDNVAHQAIDAKNKVPESEQGKNDSVRQGGADLYKEKMEKFDSFTLIDKELIQNLKTKIDSTGDAVVSDDEETKRVTLDDQYLDVDGDMVDESYDAQYEEDLIEESTEPPLLSYDESDENLLDQSAFENHSTTTTITSSETKETPPEEEVEVPVDMGHATTLKPKKEILTTWGDTFFAIVSGGETTREVTHPDGMDSEEEEDEDSIEHLEEDSNLYLLGMDKNSVRQHDHSEHSLDEDIFVLEEDLIDETLSVVEVDKSSQTEPINITTTNLSSGETLSPVSETDAELLTEEQAVTEQTGKLDGEAAEPRDPVKSETAKEDSQLPTNDNNATNEEFRKSLEDSELPETKLNENIEENENNLGGATSEDPSLDLKESKEIEIVDRKIDLEDEEDLEEDNSTNEEIMSSEDSTVEHPNTNQDKTVEIKSVETKLASLDLAVPEDVKPTSDIPNEVENTQQQSPFLEKKETVSPGSEEKEGSDGIIVEDAMPVDEINFEKSSTEEDNKLPNQDDTTQIIKLGEIETKKEVKHEQLKPDYLEAGQPPEDITGVSANNKVSEVEVHLSDQDDEENSPLIVDRKENDVDNTDELLEDENAASARRAKELLTKAESDHDHTENVPKSVSEEIELNQETAFKKLEPENEETHVQAAYHSVPADVEDKKVVVVTEPKKDDVPKANNEETEGVDEHLTVNNIDSDISGIETKQEATTTVEEDVEKATKEDTRAVISDLSHDKSANVEEPGESLTTATETLEEVSYIESIKALTIMRDYLDEQKIAEFTNILGSDNLLRLEAMLQDMDSELKLARRDNVRLDYIDKALDEILEASELSILGFVETVLDAVEVNSESTATEKEMDDLLEDVQEISYKLRQKHSTLSDTSLLAPGVQDTEVEAEDKTLTEEGDSELDKRDPEQDIKEEDPTGPDPQGEEIAEQPPALQEAGPEDVYATKDPLVSPTRGPDGAIAKDEEEPGAVAAAEGGSETNEPESQPLFVSQILSSMGSALLAAEKTFTPVASLVSLEEHIQGGQGQLG